MLTNVQAIGTAAEAISFVDVSNAGFVLFKNLDTTNYVEIGLDSAVTAQVFLKLLAGEFSLIKAKTLTMYAKANTGACNLLVVAVEL